MDSFWGMWRPRIADPDPEEWDGRLCCDDMRNGDPATRCLHVGHFTVTGGLLRAPILFIADDKEIIAHYANLTGSVAELCRISCPSVELTQELATHLQNRSENRGWVETPEQVGWFVVRGIMVFEVERRRNTPSLFSLDGSWERPAPPTDGGHTVYGLDGASMQASDDDSL